MNKKWWVDAFILSCTISLYISIAGIWTPLTCCCSSTAALSCSCLLCSSTLSVACLLLCSSTLSSSTCVSSRLLSSLMSSTAPFTCAQGVRRSRSGNVLLGLFLLCLMSYWDTSYVMITSPSFPSSTSPLPVPPSSPLPAHLIQQFLFILERSLFVLLEDLEFLSEVRVLLL